MLKQEDHIITEETAIFKATNLPMNLIGKWKVKPLRPAGSAMFIGQDGINDLFVIGKEYPFYYNEGYMVIGNDGKGYSLLTTAWRNINHF